MANVLEASLLDLTTLSADTSGDSVDIGLLRRAAHVEYRVESVSGTVTLILETSADDTAWRTVDSRSAKVGSTVFAVLGLSRYIRFRATVTGGSVQMQASAEAHVLYCDPADLVKYGLPSVAMEVLSTTEQMEACLAATDEADGYINSSYKLPLTGWGRDLRAKVAKLAVIYILDQRGWDIEGPDERVNEAHEKALKWLSRIADGKLKPPGIVDSTPTTFEGGSVVLSGTKRGW